MYTAIAPEEDMAERGDNYDEGVVEKDDEMEEEGDNNSTENMVSTFWTLFRQSTLCSLTAPGLFFCQDIAVEEMNATPSAAGFATATPSKLKSDDALRALNSILHSSSRNTPTTATTVTTPTTNNDNISKEESTMNRACIIHMDSLGMHSTPAVGKALRK